MNSTKSWKPSKEQKSLWNRISYLRRKGHFEEANLLSRRNNKEEMHKMQIAGAQAACEVHAYRRSICPPGMPVIGLDDLRRWCNVNNEHAYKELKRISRLIGGNPFK